MNNSLIRIVCLLDRSGSMGSILEQSITAFNKFIDSLKASPDGTCSFKLIQFDDKYEVNYDVPLREVPQLTASTFVPRGATAYLDAMGRAITELGVELNNTPESDRPGKVIFVTLTDGLENASTIYKTPEGLKQVAEMIKHQQDKYSWDFMFLGAEHGAVDMAVQLNIPQNKVMYYDKSFTAQAMNSAGQYVNTVRSRGVCGQSASDVGFDEQERNAAQGIVDPVPQTVTP